MGHTSTACASRMYTHRKRISFALRLDFRSFSTWIAARNGGQVHEPAHTTVRSPHQSFNMDGWPSSPIRGTAGNTWPGCKVPFSARFARAYTDNFASSGLVTCAVCMRLTAIAMPSAEQKPCSMATSRCMSLTTSSHCPPAAVHALMRSNVSGANRSSSCRLSIFSNRLSSSTGSSRAGDSASQCVESQAFAMKWATFLSIASVVSCTCCNRSNRHSKRRDSNELTTSSLEAK
mmetsp:Transcript_48877/g.90162  ORF Transcript_48877/g.90162 Transcript_48877/m.90162 type:complete len:233 (+) Transcript_48877:441-1139(+)